MKIEWTDEKIERLKELVARSYTSYRIAEDLKVTRSAVCAKCRRLGLRLRGYDWRLNRRNCYEKSNPLALSDFGC